MSEAAPLGWGAPLPLGLSFGAQWFGKKAEESEWERKMEEWLPSSEQQGEEIGPIVGV